MQQDRMPSLYRGFASTTMDVFSPVKTVIIDMIMVQLLTIIVTICLILITSTSTMNSDQIAWMMGGLLFSVLMSSAVYSRISSI
jgi:hypothetical protein